MYLIHIIKQLFFFVHYSCILDTHFKLFLSLNPFENIINIMAPLILQIIQIKVLPLQSIGVLTVLVLSWLVVSNCHEFVCGTAKT